MDSVWEELSAPFSLRDLEWRVVRLSPDGMSAQVRPQLRLELVRTRFTAACGLAGWSYSFSGMGEGAVACTLSALGAHRSAVAARTPQRDLVGTSEDALVYAAEAFGVRAAVSPAELPWVDYDPEYGHILFEPDLFELGALPQQGDPARLLDPTDEGEPAPAGSPDIAAEQSDPLPEASLPPLSSSDLVGARDALPRELPSQRLAPRTLAPEAESSRAAPQSAAKPAGQRAIDRLLERLKDEGLGLQAAKLVVEYGGYGSDPQAARELYAQLRGLLLTRSDEL